MISLDAEVRQVSVEHARADTKGGILLAPAGIAIPLLVTGPGGVLANLAAVAWAVCGVLVLAVTYPRVRAVGVGMVAYARLVPEQVVRQVEGATELQEAELLVAMSRLGLRKYRLVQAADWAAGVAFVLSAVAMTT